MLDARPAPEPPERRALTAALRSCSTSTPGWCRRCCRRCAGEQRCRGLPGSEGDSGWCREMSLLFSTLWLEVLEGWAMIRGVVYARGSAYARGPAYARGLACVRGSAARSRPYQRRGGHADGSRGSASANGAPASCHTGTPHSAISVCERCATWPPRDLCSLPDRVSRRFDLNLSVKAYPNPRAFRLL